MICAFIRPRVLFISSVYNTIYEKQHDEENELPS